MLNALTLADKKTLLILPENNKNVAISGRNLPNAKITTVETLNTYDVLDADNILLVEGSIEKINNILNK